jgi:HD superfamily phosphodiesterase
MTIAEIMAKMIRMADGNIHDIDHFIRVWTYAKTIGELEHLDAATQFILEAAAITHDIACPLCRKKYGNTNGKLQEKEGLVLVESFFADTDCTREQIERVKYLVGHHHTLKEIDGPDHQILIEADYIANALENGYSKKNIENFMRVYVRTKAGKQLMNDVFKKTLDPDGCR